jgi:diamine N-acetyltransferase
MTEIVLREITRENFRECVSLTLEPWQQKLVAPNFESLAEAKVDPTLVPLAIYDRAALGAPLSDHRMVGFTMYGAVEAVGFVKRLMIDKRHQRQGYARAAMREVIRRLRLYPEVQLIGTRHRRCNEAAANLYRSLGFIAWEVSWRNSDPDEVYVALHEAEQAGSPQEVTTGNSTL